MMQHDFQGLCRLGINILYFLCILIRLIASFLIVTMTLPWLISFIYCICLISPDYFKEHNIAVRVLITRMWILSRYPQ